MPGVHYHRHPGQPGGRASVEQRALVVRMNDVGPPAAERTGELADHARAAARPEPLGGHRPAQGLDVVGKATADPDRDELEIEAAPIRVPGKLDKQLLLTADVQAERDMQHADARTRAGIASRFPVQSHDE